MSIPDKSPAELLAECNAAISRCLNAQSYTIAERTKNMADLAQLQALRKELMAEVQNSSNGGQMASVGMIDRPSR